MCGPMVAPKKQIGVTTKQQWHIHESTNSSSHNCSTRCYMTMINILFQRSTPWEGK
jgi:hypothetical protein